MGLMAWNNWDYLIRYALIFTHFPVFPSRSTLLVEAPWGNIRFCF